MTIRDLGRAWPFPAIDLDVGRHPWCEDDVERALGENLRAAGARVWHQERWSSGIPDIIAVATVPVIGVLSLTVIEVKLATAGSQAMAQLTRYMRGAIERLELDYHDWVLQGAIAAPFLRVPEALWPRWFTYMPLRVHAPVGGAS